ncbi:tandem-95 repeat protein [Methanoculleus sp. YWC-01]|uniref:Tandem-95 repeat protein n=1 Tax=Methanoculleus nereidis TaxID=2735141 RepID=A0ABU3Z4A7_9EURY|nr:Ig-like domain-containing protein [Methanoculleus sp. YWC-01]MDV4343621.1 tandem-95 repeat protein [Methanoculleus sp. YWC-01]
MRVRKSAIAGVLLLLIAVLAVPVAAAEEYVFVAKWGSYGTGDGQFDQPWGVAVDSADNVYVAELINDRIQKFDSSGNFLTMWGSSGTNDGQFQRPQAVAVDTAGNVYVTDDGNSRVQKFDDSGRFITAWGSKGSDDGNFSWPAGIAVNAVGNIYVADAGNNRIQKFTGSAFLIKWGSYGTGDGQFDRPWGVAVDSADNVYVVDNWNHRIQKFDADGTFLTTLGSLGANEGQFLYPQGVTVDRAGNVYVADTSNYRIQKFDADGTFLTMWGSSGYSDGQFWSPWSVAVDSAGNVYVADRGNNRIQKFAPIPIPTITGIAPNSSTNNGPVSITDLSGTGFIDGATVKLTRAEEADIVATNVSVLSSTQITCTLDLTSAATGSWNVVVANPGGQPVTLADGFTVTAGNQAPVAANDTYTADEGVTLSVDAPGVLANDNDPDGDPLTAVLVDDVSNGKLDLNADGSFTYMPDTGFSGIDTFTYTANAGSQSSNVATVSIMVNPASAVLTSIVVTPAEATLDVGATRQFTATGYDQYENPLPTGEVVWSSTNDTVGTIDASGLFTALAAGSTELIAEANGTSGKANVTVTPAAQVLTSIAVTPESPALEIGTAQQFTATCYDQYGQTIPDVTVSWSSSNISVGTIESDGMFTALTAGSTTVTASADDISGQTVATVNPSASAVTRIAVSPPSVTLDMGDTQAFVATCYDQYEDEMPGTDVSWSSDNTTVGTIDATGLFTATAEGSTTVTATATEISGTAEVAVTPALTVTGIAPNSSTNNGPVSITDLSGTGFVDGATVKLTRAEEADIVATNVSILSSTQITCTLDLTGAAVGPWNVVVTNPDERYDILSDGFAVVAVSEVVTFNDPGLEAAVREALGKPVGDITAEDMAGLDTLNADWRGISDLSGLEYATNLQGLNLRYNFQISDLGPLAGLTNLQTLFLDHNQISDLSPLTGLTSLQHLGLGVNQISDLSPLAGLTNLRDLDLAGNQISDLGPLADLTNLQHLYLSGNQISDLGPLAGLMNLQTLDLYTNQISDLGPLTGLANLQDLSLHNNQISDLSPLTGLTNLQDLSLHNNQISDLSPLTGLTNLQTLFLYNNQISNLSPLAGMTNLQMLFLESNQISDLGPLADLTNLQTLDLDHNQISDLGPLAGLTNLGSLDLGYNQISDLGPLADLTNLQHLYLSGNQISDLGPLAGLTNLGSLYLGYNQISDISPLVANSGLGSRDYVYLHYNYLDLTPGSAAMNDIQTLLDRGVYAYYKPQNPLPTYTLDLAVNPDGSGTVTGAGTYAAGATVSITATPNEGWVFINWTNATGTPVSSEPNFDYAMPAQNTALIANFEPAPPVLTRIDVSPAEATLDVGATRQFTATGYDQYGNPIPAGEIVWSSTNDTVGTIDATGLFTATAEGSTTVTATAGEVSGTAEVIVTPALTVTGITPDAGPNTGPVSITDLSGTGFVDGATVKLTRTGEPDIVATNVSVVSPTQITCTLDLTGAAVGPWNVMVTNPSNQSATLTDRFTVNAGNRAPIAGDDTYTTDEDTLLTVAAPGVLENDNDPDGDTLTASLVASTTNGTLALNPDGSFAYTPNPGWSGNDTFTYAANDSLLASNTATVTITVNAVNEAPTAADDTYVTDENIPLTITAPGVLANDGDPDGDMLTAVLVVGVTNGTLTFNPDGSFTYTPNAGWSGNDTFTYTANDSLLASNVATVTITVNAVNEAPVAVDDNYTTDEGTTLTVSAPGVLANDDDPDGDALTAALDAGPGHGTLTLNPDGSFIYTPESGFSGTDSFTYTANDGTLGSATATVTITVNPVNEAPITVDDTYATDEGVTLSVNAPGVLANDDDPDADTLTAVLVDGVSHGTLTLNPDGSFVYTPDTDFAGTDSFTYRASDGELESATATVTITVTAVNHPPVAAGDACTLEQDTTHTEPAPGVLANDDDPDGDDLTAVLESSVSHGSLTLNTDGSFTYTPNAGWSGIDTFTYKAFDGELYSDVATVTITVTEAANNPPEVTAVTAPTDPQLPGSLIQVTGTFTDPDAGDTHTATWTWGDGATSEGTVDEATGTVSGSHTYTAPGTCTITLTVTDSEGASGTGTTTVTVQTPAEATTDLITRVESLELSSGIENGLTSKLDNAIEKLNKGNERTAVNQLNAFINQVKAQRGKKIPTEEADALIAMVQKIIESI